MGPQVFRKPDEAFQTTLLSSHIDRQPENRLTDFNKLVTEEANLIWHFSDETGFDPASFTKISASFKK